MTTPRERFIHALEGKPPIPGARVPHFELVYYLTMETFGKVHPCHRHYDQWTQMREAERRLHRAEMAEIFIQTAERFEHDAILLHPNPWTLEEAMHLIDAVRARVGDRYFLMLHGDATYALPSGAHMAEFSYALIDDPQGVKDRAQRKVDDALVEQAKLAAHGGLDGLALCADYCFNNGPFLSPGQFGEFVAPYLKALVAGQRALGFYVIKHTDGNIMPILDALVDANPHALHSLDPQGGVDIAEVKRRCGHRVCLIGNVNCGLMDSGTEEEVAASVRYALAHGMPGGGYVFSTSNCIYTGMDPERYAFMHRIWQTEGYYPPAPGG